MTISKDRVKPSPIPDSWKLSEIFATGVVIGTYLAITTVIFFWLTYETSFFNDHFGVEDFNKHKLKISDPIVADLLNRKLGSAVYLQVSTISQALIFVTRSRGWSFMEMPGLLLLAAFIVAQLLATVVSAVVTIKFAGIHAIGWKWTAVIWLYTIVIYVFLDPIKFAVRYALSGRAWGLVTDNKTAFSTQRDFGKEKREAAWAAEQRTLHGLPSSDHKSHFDRHAFKDISVMAEEAKRRA